MNTLKAEMSLAEISRNPYLLKSRKLWWNGFLKPAIKEARSCWTWMARLTMS